MIKIRNGCFETNSSSVHAIIIARGDVTLPLVDRTVYFGLGEYGWEENGYYSPNEKASYFYTAACSVCERDVSDEIKALLKPYGVKCKFEKPKFNTYEYDGRVHIYLKNGSIDHDCECKEFVDAMMSDSEMLVRFLFNIDSFVQTGNDNSDMEWYDDIKAIEYPHDMFVKGN